MVEGKITEQQLRREILELSERMARLEGLVLDLVSQLVPAMTRCFIQLPQELSKTTSPLPPPLPPGEGLESLGETPESYAGENPAPPKKSWWSRFLGA